MELITPGRHSSKDMLWRELDTIFLWNSIKPVIINKDSFKDAKSTIQEYVDTNNIQPSGLWSSGVESEYLIPLFTTYLEKKQDIVYNRRVAQKIIDMMINHLDLKDDIVKGYIILEGFQAEHQFFLEKDIQVRPIEDRELFMLGRIDPVINPGYSINEMTPRSDWWICETNFPNPKGSEEGWNRIHQIIDNLALTLRMFKPGGVSIGFGTQQLISPFGRMMFSRGGRLEKLNIGEIQYTLSSREIIKFKKYWQNMHLLFTHPQHYLQIPFRRMRWAGTRKEKEDALVDYVIGIEALLGTKDEQTELGYRFRMRGSVLLANKKSDRKYHLDNLKELYRLRSVIVHGSPVAKQMLDKYTPIAEIALRNIWNWYFKHFPTESDNRVGIESIDIELIGKK